MNRLLKKVVLVGGDEEIILQSIVYTLLAEDATVIVPAKSADEINRLNEYVGNICTGKLVTCLTEYNDFDKIQEIAGIVTEQYGAMDLAIFCFASTQTSLGLTSTHIADWERMIEMNITSHFIGGRILLKALNSNNGLFISICNIADFIKQEGSALANLSAMIQTEIAKLFYEELSSSGLRYHHLFINYASIDKQISHQPIGEFIIQLYEGTTSHPNSLFQTLTEEQVSEKELLL